MKWANVSPLSHQSQQSRPIKICVVPGIGGYLVEPVPEGVPADERPLLRLIDAERLPEVGPDGAQEAAALRGLRHLACKVVCGE